MSDPTPKAPRWALWLPLALFLGFVGLVIVGLVRPASHDIPSRMIGQPLPRFDLRPAADGLPGLSNRDFAGGRPRLLNIFASWCIPCGVEAPVLAELQRQGVQIDGIAIRDHKDELAAFLARNGNPYARIGADDISAVQLAIGSSGVPESFVIDGKGVIRYQHIGDIRPEQVPMILQKLKEAER
ncbi:MAG: redoxin family protein [Sphingomonadales bacterium]|nr:redoxin family protein [Sphingomonadales bacterium]